MTRFALQRTPHFAPSRRFAAFALWPRRLGRRGSRASVACFVCGGLWALAGCQTGGPHTAAGSAVGGLTGATIGAMAGASRGKSLEGAAIGAVAGTALGGLMGQEVDRAERREEAAWNAALAEASADAVPMTAVAEMATSGLSDSVIIGHIQSHGVRDRLTTADLIWLKQRGVSDDVIRAMQSEAPAAERVAVPVRAPVYVYDDWGPPPPPMYWPAGRPWRRPACPPAGVHWHVRF